MYEWKILSVQMDTSNVRMEDFECADGYIKCTNGRFGVTLNVQMEDFECADGYLKCTNGRF